MKTTQSCMYIVLMLSASVLINCFDETNGPLSQKLQIKIESIDVIPSSQVAVFDTVTAVMHLDHKTFDTYRSIKFFWEADASFGAVETLSIQDTIFTFRVPGDSCKVIVTGTVKQTIANQDSRTTEIQVLSLDKPQFNWRGLKPDTVMLQTSAEFQFSLEKQFQEQVDSLAVKILQMSNDSILFDTSVVSQQSMTCRLPLQAMQGEYLAVAYTDITINNELITSSDSLRFIVYAADMLTKTKPLIYGRSHAK